MDEAAVVATEFVNTLDNLQQEFQFILNEIKLRDQSSSEIRDNIQRKETELNTTMLKNKPPSNNPNNNINKKEDVEFDDYIKPEYLKLEKLANEKVEWGNKLRILMDKHVKRVNVDLITVQHLSANLNSGTAPVNSPAAVISNPFNQKAPQTPTPAAINKAPAVNSQKRPSVSEKGTTPSTSEAPQKKRKLSSLNPNTSTTNKKARQSSAKPSESEEDQSIEAMEDESVTDSNKGGVNGEADEDDAAYCYCQKKSYGNMIGCENDDCPISWFHFGCVNIKPPEPDVWYCTECKNKLGISTQTPSKKLLQALKKKK